MTLGCDVKPLTAKQGPKINVKKKKKRGIFGSPPRPFHIRAKQLDAQENYDLWK